MKKKLICAVVLALFLSPAAAMAVDAGEKSVDFSGESTAGKVKLSDYLGKKNVVLALFFRAFTPV